MGRILKRIGIGIGGLFGLILILLGSIYLIGSVRADQTVEVTPTLTRVSPDSVMRAQGTHLVQTLACRECHGPKLAGRVFADAPPFRIVASNLTAGAGGIGSRYTVADWDRAIRHGLRPDGTSLKVMPSSGYHNLTDADTEALIAYLQSIPPVDNELPPTEMRWLGNVLVGVGEFDPHYEVRPSIERPRPVPPGPTAEYGAYLASLTCATCHGSQLQGQPHPDPEGPYSPTLYPASTWPYEAFVKAVRTGVRPGGSMLDPHWMPWPHFKHHTDTELQALYAHLQTLSPPAASEAP